MNSEQEREALITSLDSRVINARKLSMGLSPNVYILVTENEFVQMVGHDILRGDFKTPRYSGFRIKVKGE